MSIEPLRRRLQVVKAGSQRVAPIDDRFLLDRARGGTRPEALQLLGDIGDRHRKGLGTRYGARADVLYLAPVIGDLVLAEVGDLQILFDPRQIIAKRRNKPLALADHERIECESIGRAVDPQSNS